MKQYKLISIFCMLLLLLMSGCQWFDEQADQDIPPQEEEREGIAYELTFKQPLDKEIEDAVRAESLLVKLEKRLPLTRSGLVNRAEKDIEIFKKVLFSLGYFSRKIDFIIYDEHTPIEVEFHITPGPRYKISNITLLCVDNPCFMPHQTPQITSDIVGIQIGDYVNLGKINNGKEKIKKYLQHLGYAFVEIQDVEAIVNEDTQQLEIIYRLRTEKTARIISTEVEGLKDLSAQFVKNRVLWSDNQLYDQTIIDKTRRKLIETGLLANVKIETEKAESSSLSDADEQPVKMKIKTSESAPRALGAGVRFATSEGVGGHLFWHHNNIRGNGEHLGFSLRSSKRERKAKLIYEVPDLFAPQQKLSNEVAAVRERTRAYVGRTISAGSQLQHPLNEYLTVSGGGIWENGRIRREEKTYNARLVGVPVEAKIDASDSLLDPTKGIKTGVRLTPYFGKLDQNHKNMTIAQGSLTAYLPFLTNEIGESRGVLAGFVKAGSIFIQNLDLVPPNKRFYAGGGGSVRGYGPQLLGPLDGNLIPTGGRSLAEFGAEARLKTTETIGFVAFLEAGAVTDSKVPDFKSKNLLWGTGLGVRYYSSVGPIRVDLAFPLKRRRDPGGKAIDAPFQFYISIGQAF